MTRLPRDAYTDPRWFAAEQRALFTSAWVVVGTKHDFESKGDYRTTRSGKASLMVVRSSDGALRGFHNVCRHRGVELLDHHAGNCGASLVCPYHRWSYGLDGSLKGVPSAKGCFPGLDRSTLGLKPASVGVFCDVVFVNPNPDADFDAWIAPLRGREYPHDLTASDVREGAPLHYDLECDWKVFVENALDGYHLAHLHARTLGGPTPELNEWHRLGDHMVWYSKESGSRHRLPLLTRPKTRWGVVRSAATAGYPGVHYLFPTTLLVATPYGLSVSSLHPKSSGRCRLSVRSWVGRGQSTDVRRYTPGYDEATNTISSARWLKHPLDTGDFQTEDVWICEKVQRGLESPAYEHGPLAEGSGGEDPIRWFHELMAGSQIPQSIG